MKCEICEFRNPKGAVTAVFIRDNKLLVLKRRDDPFKGLWDLPGGFMQEGEAPEEALKREIKEELGIDLRNPFFMRSFPGTYFWKGEDIPIISSFFLLDIKENNITLDQEHSDFSWVPLSELEPERIAFDSNQRFLELLKKEFTFDLKRIQELVSELDSSVKINEQSFYLAKLNGFLATRYEGSKLIGIGWIFPRQTLLRKQAVVEDMIVDSAYRGKGLGRELLDDLVNWAKDNGVEVIELTSNPQRIAANELYKKYGFELHPTNHYLYKIDK